MTENLRYRLSAGVAATGSYNDGTTFSFDPTSCDINGDCSLNGNTVANASGISHYSWYAATAQIGMIATGENGMEDIDGSICPAHWKIPNSYNYNVDKSYGNLTNVYEITTGGATTYSDTAYITMESVPLSFSREGGYYNGKLSYAGTTNANARYWVSTASTADRTGGLYYDTDRVTPTNLYGYRYAGFSVRCVAL